MKTRRCDREAVALSAVGALDGDRVEAIRVHLESCPECRRYHAEIAALGQDLSLGERALPDLELPRSVTGKVFRGLAGNFSGAAAPGAGHSSTFRSWVAAGAVAGVVVVVLGLTVWHGLRTVVRPVAGRGTESPAVVAGTLEPRATFQYRTYRSALRRSEADFERLFVPEGHGHVGRDEAVVYRPGRARIEAEL